MVKKKDFTEYTRNLENFEKKPLSKDIGKLIFPPKSDIKKSEEQDASVLPATPKLSMRKNALLFPEEEKLLKEISDIHGEDGEEVANIVKDFYTGGRENMSRGKNKQVLQRVFGFLDGRDDEISKYLRDRIGEFFVSIASIKSNPKTGAWENLPRGWTEKSLRSFWNSLGGKGEHKVTRCIEKMKDDIDNPGAFCASLERRIESSNLEGKKLAVGDKILTSTKKKAKVIKVGAELAFWMSLDGNDFGSDFVDNVELIESIESTVPVEGLVKEIPLEEKTDLGEKV